MAPDSADSNGNQFAEHIVATYTALVTSWLRKMISGSMVSVIDSEELRSKILFDLICELRKVESRTYEPDEIVCICRTITNHNTLDAIKYAKRLKRRCGVGHHSLIDMDKLRDFSISLRPEVNVEVGELVAAMRDSLDADHLEVFERKRLGWANIDIANQLEVCVRTIQFRLTLIRVVLKKILEVRNTSSNVQRPTSNVQRPTSNVQRPTSNHQSPITNHQSPITNHQSPITVVALFDLSLCKTD